MKRIENILRRLINIDTTNPPGREMDAVNEIIKFFPEGTDHKIVDHGNNRGSLMIEIKGKAQEKIGFIGHIDTVPVQDESSWIHPPFDGIVQDGYLYGRGASDMKGAVSAMAVAACDFYERKRGHFAGTILIASVVR